MSSGLGGGNPPTPQGTANTRSETPRLLSTSWLSFILWCRNPLLFPRWPVPLFCSFHIPASSNFGPRTSDLLQLGPLAFFSLLSSAVPPPPSESLLTDPFLGSPPILFYAQAFSSSFFFLEILGSPSHRGTLPRSSD